MAITNTTSKSLQRSRRTHGKLGVSVWLLSGMVLMALAFVAWQASILEGVIVGSSSHSIAINSNHQSERLRRDRRPNNAIASISISDKNNEGKDNRNQKISENACGLGFSDLTDEEIHPKQGDRHMVDPPEGGIVSLVCCETTKGNLSLLVHHNWAPIGAAHFLDLVKGGYFDTTVPLMRCMKNFLCQFGINSDPETNKKFRNKQTLQDDPNWLPEGPQHRTNEDKVERFARGYLAYAGAGKNSRGNQFIVSLKDNERLAGGSPWEVPWGELVGNQSFETLSKIYTGYGEKGPKQGEVGRRGMDEDLRKKFPDLDYINRCVLVEEREIDPDKREAGQPTRKN